MPTTRIPPIGMTTPTSVIRSLFDMQTSSTWLRNIRYLTATKRTSSTLILLPTCLGVSMVTCACRHIPRNTLLKDNAFFTFDFGVDRPFRLGESMRLIPRIEVFNTFNNKNNVNPLSSPALFDFSGFLRVGVGDPRQAQLSVRFEF